jgi:hypothetical protein
MSVRLILCAILCVLVAVCPMVGRAQAPNSACKPGFTSGDVLVTIPAVPPGGPMTLEWEYNMPCQTASQNVKSPCEWALTTAVWIENNNLSWAPASFANGGTSAGCATTSAGCGGYAQGTYTWSSAGSLIRNGPKVQVYWTVYAGSCDTAGAAIVGQWWTIIPLSGGGES